MYGLNWTLGLHGDGLKVGGGTGVTGRYVQLVVVHILGIWDAFDETCRLDLRDLSLFHLFLDAYTRSYIHYIYSFLWINDSIWCR